MRGGGMRRGLDDRKESKLNFDKHMTIALPNADARLFVRIAYE